MSAAQQRAVEALRKALSFIDSYDYKGDGSSDLGLMFDVRNEGRAALAAVDARAEAEALGCRLPDGDDPEDYAITLGLAAVDADPRPLQASGSTTGYAGGTAAPVAWGVDTQRQPLSDGQINAIVREAAKGSAIRRDGSTSHRIARAIEKAHGIGGEA